MHQKHTKHWLDVHTSNHLEVGAQVVSLGRPLPPEVVVVVEESRGWLVWRWVESC